MLRLSNQVVKPEWIDYNGHMNVAYYTLAFDNVMDEMLTDQLGIDHDFVKQNKMGPFALQSNFTYLAEMHHGDTFYGSARILDYDHKKMHLFATLHRAKDDVLSATWEGLSINVDHHSRSSTPYPAEILQKIQHFHRAMKDLPIPEQVGKKIAIRR